MIYTTGAVSTVSGSAIVKGTGTKFKNNNPAINIGMTILIKSGTTNIPYMIKSVNSDTELVLAQPALATATNTAFSIHITEPDNNSDAARTMVAINSYAQYFLDAMNTWMSETGQTKIEMPNGEVVTLDSIKKMQGDISEKLDKSGGDVGAINIITNRHGRNLALKRLDSTPNSPQPELISFHHEDDTRRSYVGFGGFDNIFRLRNESTKKICGFDIEETFKIIGPLVFSLANEIKGEKVDLSLCGFFRKNYQDEHLGYSIHIAHPELSGASHARGLTFSYGPKNDASVYSYDSTGKLSSVNSILILNENTITDSNGFYKKASPIIDINPDGTFTTNDESEGATVTRVRQGEYLIEGVLGFNSDAGWGGVDGGIEIPLDVNKQPLVWVNSKVNKDGSILVKTYHRTHPNAPKFARNDIDGYNDGDPIDIPDGRFISVRVQMPEQSIYNVRMSEMEEAQKAEEERRQKEEEENQDTNKTPEMDN
ncbi:hypothetical protein KZA80_06745 [Proteus terrae]|uniref:phage tail fiber protein n=1 Tax=Proteus terrae TaxID=1574161 RepID=UPI0021B35FDB|nr:hypothetical protein [Proteus terrae]UXA35606.1 hypothetical protein KZA80_06745 [Proteus terrae]